MKKSAHPLYKKWQGIKDRCHNPNCRDYDDYGARGIYVCDEWRYDVDAFMAWCLDNGWSDGLHLDREDNDKPYEPGNCRFLAPASNCQNRRSSKRWTVDGLTYTSARDAAKAHKVSESAIRRWCLGYGKHPPRPGCFAKPAYPDKPTLSDLVF